LLKFNRFIELSPDRHDEIKSQIIENQASNKNNNIGMRQSVYSIDLQILKRLEGILL